MTPEQTKKGRRRSVEINDTLFAWLAMVCREIRHPIRPGLRMVRHLVCSCSHAEASQGSGHSARNQTRFGIRFASYHLAEHKDIDALVLALGHRGSPTVLWEHYHRAVKKSDAKAFWAINPPAGEASEKIVAIA